MPKRVNKVRNERFLAGRIQPTGWRWDVDGAVAAWERRSEGRACGVTIRTSRSRGRAVWSQVVHCKPGEFYRVDADVTCALEAADERAGFVIAAQPLVGIRPRGDAVRTPGVHVASRTRTVRAFYQAPAGSRRVRLSVGISNAKGWATVEAVRFLHTLEPEEDSHLLAIPPPPQGTPAQRVVQTVCVHSRTALSRPLTTILRAALGDSNVVACDDDALPVLRPERGRARAMKRGRAECDAILLPDPAPPQGLRSLRDLLDLAERQLVVISLPAFAALCGKSLSLRRVEQPDDPICAKVMFANHATRGFALHDVFPYAWAGRSPGSFVQNHFRRTPSFSRFMKKHDFATLLGSMACQEVTTGRAVALHKRTSGGGLFVMDLDPMEADPSTRSETNVAVYLLLSILGHTQNGLGQFAMPVRAEAKLREMIREASVRFREFVVHDGDGPVDEIDHQLVTIGREDDSFGLPLKPKPLVLVRTGLRSGDVESVYGAFLWFKQLLRMPPHRCAYADALSSRFRLAWIPCAARWERADGWMRRGAAPTTPLMLDIDDAELACVIDVVSIPRNEVRVVTFASRVFAEHVATWLPRLQAAFSPGRYFSWAPADHDSFSDLDRFAWRRLRHEPTVRADEADPDDEFLRQARRVGAEVVRLEVPGGDADFVAHSIQRTDVVATLLEQLIGLRYGLIAVNRTTSRIRFNGFPPVDSDAALIVRGDDAALQAARSRAG